MIDASDIQVATKFVTKGKDSPINTVNAPVGCLILFDRKFRIHSHQKQAEDIQPPGKLEHRVIAAIFSTLLSSIQAALMRTQLRISQCMGMPLN